MQMLKDEQERLMTMIRDGENYLGTVRNNIQGKGERDK